MAVSAATAGAHHQPAIPGTTVSMPQSALQMNDTLLTILEFPDPRLRKVAAPVTDFGDSLSDFTGQMLKTMYAAPGIGLAATQVNVHKQIVVLDLSDSRDVPMTLINPVIMSHSGDFESNEGCLSVPAFYEPVRRSEFIHLVARDSNGDEFELDADGMLAVCIQHEMDHLKGKLFVDYLSSTKRQMIRKKLLKQQKQR